MDIEGMLKFVAKAERYYLMVNHQRFLGRPVRRITCWHRIIDGVPKWNHFDYEWLDITMPIARSDTQKRMWKGAKWKRVYGWLVDGVVREFD